MNEYRRIADRIAGHLTEAEFEGGLSVEDVLNAVGGDERGGPINCYPGEPGHGCHDLAVFVSLESNAHKGKHRGHISCKRAIEKLVQHMQGTCVGHTKRAVLVVDSWNVKAAEDWRWNLRRIKSDAHLEIYLVTGSSVSEISV